MTNLRKTLFWVGLLMALFLLLFAFGKLARAAEPSTRAAALEVYVESFFHGIMPKRMALAKTYVPAVITAADKYNVDEFLIAEIISKESSWRFNALGADGEIGLGQQLPQWNPGVDFTTPGGQIDGIAKRLRFNLNTCGGALAAINHYKMGKCGPVVGSVRWRYLQYLKTKGIYHGKR